MGFKYLASITGWMYCKQGVHQSVSTNQALTHFWEGAAGVSVTPIHPWQTFLLFKRLFSLQAASAKLSVSRLPWWVMGLTPLSEVCPGICLFLKSVKTLLFHLDRKANTCPFVRNLESIENYEEGNKSPAIPPKITTTEILPIVFLSRFKTNIQPHFSCFSLSSLFHLKFDYMDFSILRNAS